MKKLYSLTIMCALVMIILVHSGVFIYSLNNPIKDKIKVGFIYVGDSCNAYTNNFLRAQKKIELQYGDKVETLAKYNVSEGYEKEYLEQLVDAECDLIFTTSFGYGEGAKEIAAENPDIEFCIATCSNANEEPRLSNVHNFMGEIYQGRYVSGVVAGMKLQELINNGVLNESQAKIGYVAAFPYSEVISGYTAFLLGVRSVVPTATMNVVYTNSWGDYNIEKTTAERLIKENCVIISQHSDTTGPATACEELSDEYNVFHVGYNQSMADVAPTTSLISSRIDWSVYMVDAVDAVLHGKKIEAYVKGNIHGNDVSGGFGEKWVQMLKINNTVAASGTKEKIDQLISDFSKGEIIVFKGDYIGVDAFDENDIFDLSKGYIENENSSAPTFHYVLKDVITIEE